MRSLSIFCVGCLFLFFANISIAQYLTHDDIGAKAVFEMYAAYNDMSSDCGTGARPPILCRGLAIRGTNYSESFDFWNPGPASRQATAFSWLSKDAKFRQLASDHRHGYVLLPKFKAPAGYIDIKWICAFVMDAGSHNRSDLGCGDFITTAQIERSCQEQGITAAAAWLRDYLLNGKSHYRQCGFDLRPAKEPDGAHAFMQFVKAHAFPDVITEHFDTRGLSNNEVRLESWGQSDGSRIPFWAIFFLSKDPVTGAATEVGKAEAQKDQMALYKKSGHFIPVVRMALPKTAAEDATFFYAPADQAQLDTVLCNRFVDKAQWENRYDPGVKANRWTLLVEPTDCGRLSQANQVDKFYAEIVAKHGTDAQWVAEYKGGVRRQLACVLATYRTKDTFNLEPFRPDVSQAQAVAASCNPV